MTRWSATRTLRARRRRPARLNEGRRAGDGAHLIALEHHERGRYCALRPHCDTHSVDRLSDHSIVCGACLPTCCAARSRRARVSDRLMNRSGHDDSEPQHEASVEPLESDDER